MPKGQDPQVCFYLIPPSLIQHWAFQLEVQKAQIPHTCSGNYSQITLTFKVCLTFSKMIKDVREGKKKKNPINQAGEKADMSRLRVNDSNIK